MGVKQKKRSNLKKNHRSTPDPFEAPFINSSSRTKQNTKINNINIRKVKRYPQLLQQQQQQQHQHQQQIYYDPRYTSSGQFFQPYDNMYSYNTSYDYSPEEYWMPSQNYFTDYQPSYTDYHRQTTNSTDNSTEYQPRNDLSNGNQRQQISSNDNIPTYPDNNYLVNPEYERERRDGYQKQDFTHVAYYEDEGYVEKRSESPESNTTQQHDDVDHAQLRYNDCHDDDIKQYIC